jgi:outer membrane protein OmpU
MSWKLLLSKKIINENEENNNNNKQRKNMNIKKIGMTALAASLVSTSVFAGEFTASGSASVAMEGYSGTLTDNARALSMGDSVILGGSTELDNGMTVSLSFTLDEGDNVDATSAVTSSVFDGHSVTISSDAMGTLKFHGEGGDSAQNAVGDTAAGNIWDNFDGKGGTTLVESRAGNNILHYTLPSMVDGLAVNASYKPQGSTAESALGYGVAYTGVDGLAVHYAITDIEGATVALSGDQTVLKATYAYGPVTVGYSNSEMDMGDTTLATDQETTSYAISYTVSDAISVTYGTEEIDRASATTDAEYEIIKGSYTSGGMTLSANTFDTTGAGNVAAAKTERWALGLSFAF